MTWVMPVLGAAAVAVAGIKWLRVAQREHYLARSVSGIRRIWLGSRVLNMAEPVLVVAAAVGWVIRPDSFWPLLGSAALAVFPLGLTLRGRTSSLVWTTRLKRMAALSAGILFGATALVTWLVLSVTGRTPQGAATIVGTVLFYFALDVALWIAGPLEKRLSQRFVDQASRTLERVAPMVVGITGSYGKTSTKWYVCDLVEGTRRVVASPASFNNRLGLARAVNEHLTADAEVFVAEMGTYGRGEIADLCSWLRPSIAVLTAIGPVHLQRFKSEDRIVLAKAEMIEGADVVVLNVDHHDLAKLADETEGRTVWRCGVSEAATHVRVHEEGDALAVRIRGELIGELNVAGLFPANLACAVAVALELGVRPADIAQRAGRLTQAEHRQSIGRSQKGFTIIDDTFNSNPAGAARALEVLARQGSPEARRVVVTPGMVELGPRQRSENVRFAAAAAEVADNIVIVGRTNRRPLIEGTREGTASVVPVSTREKAVEWVRAHLGPGDAVLYENDLPDHYP